MTLTKFEMAQRRREDAVSVSYGEDDEDASISSTESDSDQHCKEEARLRDQIVRREEQNVRRSRWLFLTAICTFTLAVSVAFYIFAKRSDSNNFELEVCI